MIQWLLSAGRQGTRADNGDDTVKIWDVATGQELNSLPGSMREVTGVVFSPQDNGAHLAVAGGVGVVRGFALRLENLLALGQARVTRTLTLGECRKYLHAEQCPGS